MAHSSADKDTPCCDRSGRRQAGGGGEVGNATGCGVQRWGEVGGEMGNGLACSHMIGRGGNRCGHEKTEGVVVCGVHRWGKVPKRAMTGWAFKCTLNSTAPISSYIASGLSKRIVVLA